MISPPLSHAQLNNVKEKKERVFVSAFANEDQLTELRRTGSYRVKDVIDDLTVTLDNGETVRLVGLDMPDRFADKTPEHVHGAFTFLVEKFKGKSVMLYQTSVPNKGRTNRMGHQLGHLIRSEDKLWAQGSFTANGFGRTRTSKANPEMAAHLYALENDAREKKRGIWALPAYQVLTSENAIEAVNGYQIVQGNVKAVASIKNTIYLNFGSNWKKDFTIALPISLRKKLIVNKHDPLKWQGKQIRVRGWLESYNGPYIEIDHIERLELIEEQSAEKQTQKTQNNLPNTLPKHKLSLIPLNTD